MAFLSRWHWRRPHARVSVPRTLRPPSKSARVRERRPPGVLLEKLQVVVLRRLRGWKWSHSQAERHFPFRHARRGYEAFLEKEKKSDWKQAENGMVHGYFTVSKTIASQSRGLYPSSWEIPPFQWRTNSPGLSVALFVCLHEDREQAPVLLRFLPAQACLWVSRNEFGCTSELTTLKNTTVKGRRAEVGHLFIPGPFLIIFT